MVYLWSMKIYKKIIYGLYGLKNSTCVVPPIKIYCIFHLCSVMVLYKKYSYDHIMVLYKKYK